MKKRLNTRSVKCQEKEMNTLYEDASNSDIIENSIFIDDDTSIYQIGSTHAQVGSWYKRERNNEIVWDNFCVIDTERWDGEVISMNEDSFSAILSLQEYPNRRLVTIKKNAVDRYTWKNIHEGSQFVWNFKTERTAKGTIRKNNQIFLKNELKMNMSDIQKVVEEEMKKFANLFADD